MVVLNVGPVDLVLNMKTHENADEETKKVDFCWDLNYIQMNNIYSTVHNAGSIKSFRAGYREGVKMSLDEGKVVKPNEFKKRIWPKNYERLITWQNIGADIDNGLWAIYGARLGCYDINLNPLQKVFQVLIGSKNILITYFSQV